MRREMEELRALKPSGSSPGHFTQPKIPAAKDGSNRALSMRHDCILSFKCYLPIKRQNK